MTFAAADGLIISAAHQSLTTTTDSPTSFPRALLPVSSAVTRGFPQATWGDNPESLLWSLLVPGRAGRASHTFPRHLPALVGLQVRPPGTAWALGGTAGHLLEPQSCLAEGKEERRGCRGLMTSVISMPQHPCPWQNKGSGTLHSIRQCENISTRMKCFHVI